MGYLSDPISPAVVAASARAAVSQLRSSESIPYAGIPTPSPQLRKLPLPKNVSAVLVTPNIDRRCLPRETGFSCTCRRRFGGTGLCPRMMLPVLGTANGPSPADAINSCRYPDAPRPRAPDGPCPRSAIPWHGSAAPRCRTRQGTPSRGRTIEHAATRSAVLPAGRGEPTAARRRCVWAFAPGTRLLVKLCPYKGLVRACPLKGERAAQLAHRRGKMVTWPS